MRPVGCLVELTRAYPGAHQFLDEARASGMMGSRDWPSWCFAPREVTLAACMRALEEDGRPLTADSIRQHGEPITHLHALLAWRPSQGVYSFHPALQGELWRTPCTGAIPVQALDRLPEWCCYVALDPMMDGINGFFVRHDLAMGEHDLLWIVDYGDRLLTQSLGLEFADDLEGALLATEEADERALRAGNPGAAVRITSLPRATIEGLLSLTLYLCSQVEFVPGNASAEKAGQPTKAEPTRTRNGPRLYPPQHPRVWRVGWDLGEALERAQGSGEGSVRPHLRRAHWHHYWVGQGRTRLELRWIHPVLVGGEQSGNNPASP
jgi:hypothetical protein